MATDEYIPVSRQAGISSIIFGLPQSLTDLYLVQLRRDHQHERRNSHLEFFAGVFAHHCVDALLRVRKRRTDSEHLALFIIATDEYTTVVGV